jgi:hypothetical protein
VRDVDKIWNYAVGDLQYKGGDIEEHLYELGLLEEGKLWTMFSLT